MIPSASLTPPLAHVEKASATPAEIHRTRSAIASGSASVGAVSAMPGRDLAQFRKPPMPTGARPGGSDASRDEGSSDPVRRNVADDAKPTVRENGTLTLRRVLDIRARSATAELVELPVPVTEILRISLGRMSPDPVAAIDARSLYEGAQGVFSRDAAPKAA